METVTSPHHREETLARIQEVALRSAYAHGKALTDFAFSLPRHDDVVTLADGSLALRMDTEESGYSPEEAALRDALFPSVPPEFSSLPSSFSEQAEVITSAHFDDLEEIVRGLIRHRVFITHTMLQDFATCSLSLHEALLALVHDLFHIDSPLYTDHLLHEAHPAYLHAQDAFLLALRRLRHDALVETATRGAFDQYRQFLDAGLTTGCENNFFAAQKEFFHQNLSVHTFI